MSYRFIGSLGELKEILDKEGIIGSWQAERLCTGGIKHIFRSENHGILTWWRSTGTVLCQGKEKESQELFDIISKYLIEVESLPKN